jgi:hypothetical protein
VKHGDNSLYGCKNKEISDVPKVCTKNLLFHTKNREIMGHGEAMLNYP